MDFDVFISYAHDDKPIADAACAIFERAGVRCWIAPRDIREGMEYPIAIEEALDTCKALVLIFSGHANESPHIRREVEHVVSRGIDLIPVRIENIEPAAGLRYYMKVVHWLDALTPPVERHLEGLAARLSARFNGTAPATSLRLEAERPAPLPAAAPPPAGQKLTRHLLFARIASVCGLVCGTINILALVALHDTVNLLLAVVGAATFYVLVFRNLTRDITMARTVNIVCTALLGVSLISVVNMGNLFFTTTEGINMIFSSWLMYEINVLYNEKNRAAAMVNP